MKARALLNSFFVLGLTTVIQAQPTAVLLKPLAECPSPPGVPPLLWDGPRRVIYCDDLTGLNVSKVGLDDGVIKARIHFDTPWGRTALSPDGNALYVALTVQPHAETWTDGQWGYIAVIDTESFIETRRFRVDLDPGGLVVAPGGLMVISSGSGRWTYADAYDIITGQKLGSVSGLIWQGGGLTLHPDGRRVYLLRINYIQRFDLDPVSRTFGRPGDIFAPNVSPAMIWAHPNGQLLIGNDGSLLKCDPVVTNEFASLGNLDGGYFNAMTFDVPHNAFFTVSALGSKTNINQFNLRTLQLAATYSPGNLAYEIYAYQGDLWVASSTLLRFANPAVGGETNQAPVAEFTFSPSTPTTQSAIILDAQGSTNHPGTSVPLLYRWDLDGDGSFDTPPIQTPTFTANYNLPGLKTVVLEVRDRFGETNAVTRSFLVTPKEDPGEPVEPHVPYRLPFAATGVVFDWLRERLLATDRAGQRLFIVDLKHGLATRQFALHRDPESLSMTPDGHWLYVGLTNNLSGTIANGNTNGFVAEFDLERGVRTRDFPIAVDPQCLTATDGRMVLIGGSSAQGNNLMSYDAASGELRGQAIMFGSPTMLLLPSRLRVLAAQTNPTGSLLKVYQLDPLTGALSVILRTNLANYHGGTLTLNEAGTLCATSLGSVFGVSADEARLGLVRNIPPLTSASATLFDADTRGMLLAGFPNELRSYNLQSMYQARSTPLTITPLFLGCHGDQVCVVGVAQVTTLEVFTTPVLGSEGNQPALLSLEYSPLTPNMRGPVVFDVRKTTDDSGGLDTLQFRWDLNGDGVFDIDWGSLTVVTQRFLTTGQRSLVVEVKDRWSAASQAAVNFNVELDADPGTPGPDHSPWQIPFPAGDIAFDMGRRQVWLSDADGQTVARVNLDTGRIERQWRFLYQPSSLAITPNHRWLYAALIPNPIGQFPPYPPGYVTEFDLEAGVQTRVIKLTFRPGDLAATDSGLLIVVETSGGGTGVNCYNLANGRLLSGTQTPDLVSLCLSPAQTQVFAAANWTSAPYITRFSYSPTTGGLGPGPCSPALFSEWGGVGNRVFVLPGESNLLGGGGAIYLNKPGSPQDLHIVANLGLNPVNDVATIPDMESFAVLSGPRLHYFRNGTLETLGRFQLGRPALALGVGKDDSFLVGITNGFTWISHRLPPANDPATNHAPTVRWKEPVANTVFVWPYMGQLATEAEDIDGGIDWVQFRENGVVLGTATNYPFVISVPITTTGDHLLEAYARDNLGATGSVATVAFRVTKRPTIEWLSPVGTTLVDPGSNLVLQATANDPDGSIAAIKYYRSADPDPILVGTVTAPPWSLVLSNFSSNTWFMAQAIDNDGVEAKTTWAFVQLAGPIGDEFYRPFKLSGTNSAVTVDNRTASNQLNEKAIFSSQAFRTLWWSWTPPIAGRYILTTRGSGCDTVLGIFTGTEINQLTLRFGNDDDPYNLLTSTIKFPAYPTNNYRFVVDGYNDSSGSVNLSLTLDSLLQPAPTNVPAPPNDKFANRTLLTGTNLTLKASNVGATAEGAEPHYLGLYADPSVWWEWVAPTNGVVHLTTTGSSFDTVLAIYTGVPLSTGPFHPVGGNDDAPGGGRTSQAWFLCDAGIHYAIAVTGYAGDRGDIQLGLDFKPVANGPPVNDAFAERIVLSGTNLVVEGSNVGASFELDEPLADYWNPKYTVWYRWRSPGWGPVYLCVQGVVFRPNAAVFTGSALTNLTLVAVTADNSKRGILSFLATAGVDYAIAVDSYSIDNGGFTLLLQAPALRYPPRLDISGPTQDGSFFIRSGNYSASAVTIFTSSDLIKWFPIRTNVFVPGEPILIAPDEQPKRFFQFGFE